MRDALDRHSAYLDEALLSNAFGYIRKCSEDGFDSMAQLIQKVRGCVGGEAAYMCLCMRVWGWNEAS